MGGSKTPGQYLGPSQHATVKRDELSRYKRLGLIESPEAAQTSANYVMAKLGSDNPGRFAAFMKSLDPNKTIGSQLNLPRSVYTDPAKFVKESATVSTGKQKLIDETKLPEISPDDIESPVVEARKKESRQALANQGRSSTIATSPQGIADTDHAVGQIARPGLRRKRISLKTLLGN